MIPLVFLREGEEAIVVGIYGGHGLVRRLTSMGIYPNVRIKLLKTRGLGPVVIEVGGTRIALGFGVASKIYVRSLS